MSKILICTFCLLPNFAMGAPKAIEPQPLAYVRIMDNLRFELQSVVAGQIYVLDHGLTVQDCADQMIDHIQDDTLRCAAE